MSGHEVRKRGVIILGKSATQSRYEKDRFWGHYRVVYMQGGIRGYK